MNKTNTFDFNILKLTLDQSLNVFGMVLTSNQLKHKSFWDLLPDWANYIVYCTESKCFAVLSTVEEGKAGCVAILSGIVSVEEFAADHVWYTHQIVASRFDKLTEEPLADKVHKFVDKFRQENKQKNYKILEDTILDMMNNNSSRDNYDDPIDEKTISSFIKDHKLENLVDISYVHQRIKFIL